MLNVLIPDSFTAERKYIVHVLLEEFLGLKLEINTCPGQRDYELRFNNKKLIIRDHFFSKLKKEENYLKAENIPDNIPYITNDFILEENIPVLYGDNELLVENDNLICGIDIFASSFFMLSRWEEYGNNERDEHNRFPAASSVAYKHQFLERPIVNEYVEMLWAMLQELGINMERKEKNFNFIFTHDVDHIKHWNNPITTLKILTNDLVRRKNIKLFVGNLSESINVLLRIKKDNYNTYNDLMNASERNNIYSRFYFMSGGITKFDNYYNIHSAAVKKIIKTIYNRGHIIGFHPSYASYNCPNQWKIEKEKLEEILDASVNEGRQHYLNFSVPYTWRIWNNNKMSKDFTLGYPEYEGFRCGTCYEFPIFDILLRDQLELYEYPLIAMDTTFVSYQKVSPEEMLTKLEQLKETIIKYNGNFVLLWHNSSFGTKKWVKHTNYLSLFLKNI